MFSGNKWFTVPICGREARDGSLVSQMKGGPKGHVFAWTTNGRGYWALSPTISIKALEKVHSVSFGLILYHRV